MTTLVVTRETGAVTAPTDGAEVVVVTVGEPEPTPEQAARLAAGLAAERLISVGYPTGRVSAAAATVLHACDLVVSGPDTVWDDALAAVPPSRLPAGRADALGAAPRPVTGAVAYELGLVVEVADDPAAAADRLAAELAGFAGGALAAAKRMVDSVPGADLAAALALESELQVARLTSEDHRRVLAERAARATARP